MRTKYFNDGIVGNRKIKASFTKSGEMIRMFYGAADYKQFVDYYHTGIKVNDSALIYLHNDINNTFSQEYIKDTNVLQTHIYNSYFRVRITQTDFVPISENVLIKHYVFKNENVIDLNLSFLIYSKILRNLNNDTSGYVKNDTLIQYNHDFSVCTFSTEKISSKQINGAENNFMQGSIGGKDYIGMSPDSSISYNLKKLKPGEEKELTIFVYINKNRNKCMLNELDDEIDRIKKLDVQNLKDNAVKYWRRYVREHDALGINKKELSSKIKKIYNRSILLFPLLVHEKTGGISAGIEVDEDKTKCGRYSYCWPRDGVFVTEAFDVVSMHEETEKFYSTFCKMTQSKNGMWEQRFYTDGRLAPCWGYQVDETASVVFGIYAHYKITKNKKFLKDNLKMCENAISFLEKYIDDLFEEKGKFQLSYDLWEENEGVAFYSVSTIFAAFSAMIKIYTEVKSVLEINKVKSENLKKQIENLEEKAKKIKEYCLNTFYDEEKKSFVRNTKDRKIDISMLGPIVPFRMFSPNDKKIKNTIERINMTLRTYTGGYIRYEGDGYMGGYNPWPIATLWMAWYYLEAGDNEKALENFAFVTNSASGHGYLGEQVNNDAMKPSWVIGLTWSHAMYLLTLEKILEKGLL